MPKEIAVIFVFQSDSDSSKTYQCLQMTDGTLTCECRGWIFKRKTMGGERSCKHTRIVLAGLGNRHAISVVEQSKVMTNRTPQKPMAEPTFTGRRRFALE